MMRDKILGAVLFVPMFALWVGYEICSAGARICDDGWRRMWRG